MMLRALFQGAGHGSARGLAWGAVFVAFMAVFLQWVFNYR